MTIKDPTKQKEYLKEYHQRPEVKQRQKEWWKNHPDKKKEYDRRYYLKHRKLKGYRKNLTEEHKKILSEALKGNKNRLGKPKSLEERRKISKSRKGMKFSKKHRENLSKALNGRKILKKVRKKMSKGQIKRWDKIGRKPVKRYKHTTGTVEYKNWRTKVFERDSYTCRGCGEKGYLEAHHLKRWWRYKEVRFDVSNGITLCKKCHRLIHWVNSQRRKHGKTFHKK